MEKISGNIIRTRNFVTIHKTCRTALEKQMMIAVVGPTGYGKTTGIITFKEENPDNVIVLKAPKSANASIFYSKLYNSIEDSFSKPNMHRYYAIRKAASAFTSQQREMLLIIDESNKFSPSMLEYLHEFRDLTRDNTGIVLSGTLEFQTDLVKWKEAGKSGIPEFYGRINAFQKLYKPNEKEIVTILNDLDIYDRKFIRYCVKKTEDFRDLAKKADNFLSKAKVI